MKFFVRFSMTSINTIVSNHHKAFFRDMLNQHFFSREAMKMSGELDGFLSLGISEELEMRWRAAYAANLLAGYETAPEGLDIVLSIVAEYHDLELMKEVLTVLDDAISEEHMAGDALIDSIGKHYFLDSWSMEKVAKFRSGLHWREYVEQLKYITNGTQNWRVDFSEVENLVKLFATSVQESTGEEDPDP